mmetsp:Transcript_31594/g.97624  ORF Transcript_31594/g.97624 Transcript_31594/m.97624 type:complete len:243 (-) Transcript_31594:837-1565(-)
MFEMTPSFTSSMSLRNRSSACVSDFSVISVPTILASSCSEYASVLRTFHCTSLSKVAYASSSSRQRSLPITCATAGNENAQYSLKSLSPPSDWNAMSVNILRNMLLTLSRGIVWMKCPSCWYAATRTQRVESSESALNTGINCARLSSARADEMPTMDSAHDLRTPQTSSLLRLVYSGSTSDSASAGPSSFAMFARLKATVRRTEKEASLASWRISPRTVFSRWLLPSFGASSSKSCAATIR